MSTQLVGYIILTTYRPECISVVACIRQEKQENKKQREKGKKKKEKKKKEKTSSPSNQSPLVCVQQQQSNCGLLLFLARGTRSGN